MSFLIYIIHTVVSVYIFIIIVNALLSFVMSPYHPVKVALDRLVNPLLDPIRRIVPSVQMIDFSPTILIFVLIVVEQILTNILSTLR